MRPRATDRKPFPSSQVPVGCSRARSQDGIPPQPVLAAPDPLGARPGCSACLELGRIDRVLGDLEESLRDQDRLTHSDLRLMREAESAIRDARAAVAAVLLDHGERMGGPSTGAVA